jgi:hypothetical protein
MNSIWSIMFAIAVCLPCSSGLSATRTIPFGTQAVLSQARSSTDQLEPVDQEQADDRTTSVGFPKLIFQHVISGPKVIAKPIVDRNQPVIVRIVETYPHGSDFRYDIEYKVLEPGTYNVADYLVRDDGSETAIPRIDVNVYPILKIDEVRPYNLPQFNSRFRSYYLPMLLVMGVVWVAGVLMILF